ncbi:hypothetical protein CS542_04680 [Pedobacter sp. IW39]|nr:hypothetical protein CS542_04680 [Pedobacter sp. IW39]
MTFRYLPVTNFYGGWASSHLMPSRIKIGGTITDVGGGTDTTSGQCPVILKPCNYTTTVDLSSNINEDELLLCFNPATGTALTAAQIKAGTDGSGNPAFKSDLNQYTKFRCGRYTKWFKCAAACKICDIGRCRNHTKHPDYFSTLNIHHQALADLTPPVFTATIRN